MANCSVLEHFQKPTDRRVRRIKRSGAQSLVNRGMAYWVFENILLQMFEVRRQVFAKAGSNPTYCPPKSFIPDRLPPNIDSMLGIIVVGIPRKIPNPHEISPWKDVGYVEYGREGSGAR